MLGLAAPLDVTIALLGCLPLAMARMGTLLLVARTAGSAPGTRALAAMSARVTGG